MKKYFKNISLMLLLFIILSMFLSSCVKNDAKKEADSDNNTGKLDFIISETDTTITINDPLENEITLDKKPQRVAVLMNSILDLWYMAGGTAVARVKGTINVPPEALDIEDLGSVGGPNIEKLIALKPDLVILTSTMAAHREMKDMLDQNGIKYLYVKLQGIQRLY